MTDFISFQGRIVNREHIMAVEPYYAGKITGASVYLTNCQEPVIIPCDEEEYDEFLELCLNPSEEM